MVVDKKWFIAKINNFLSNDESNKMVGVDNSFIFEPNTIVGFVSGNDSIFNDYKDIIGKFHLTPIEAFSKFCEKNNYRSTLNDLSVVTFVLPINKQTKKENFEY